MKYTAPTLLYVNFHDAWTTQQGAGALTGGFQHPTFPAWHLKKVLIIIEMYQGIYPCWYSLQKDARNYLSWYLQ